MRKIPSEYVLDLVLWLEEKRYVLSPTKARPKSRCNYFSDSRTPIYWIYPEEAKEDRPREEKKNRSEDYPIDKLNFPLPIACLGRIGKEYCVVFEKQKYFKTEKYHKMLEEVLEAFFSQ